MSKAKRVLAGGGLLILSVAFWLTIDRLSSQPNETRSREVRFLYRLTLPDVSPSGQRIFAWIPMPFTDTYQTLRDVQVKGPATHTTAVDAEYGNRFLVLDLSDAARSSRDSVTVEVEYRVSRRGYRVLETTAGVTHPANAAAGGPEKFLLPSRLIPIDGKIAAEARTVTGRLDDPLGQARALYDHIVESVLYDKSGQGWGKGDAVYACDFRKGNCTDFHSLFIGEARSLGIPARFVMGFPLPARQKGGAIPGYHCWAEFFVDPYGWVPIDASEAQKDRARQEELFGGLDANRIGFTIGRDIRLPGASAGPLNYVIYPHVEIDGKIYSEASAEFEFAEILDPLAVN